MAVDLNPSSERKEHPIAMYTYDADGQRIIKYLKKQLDFTVNAGNYNSANKAETFLYPSGRITAKVIDYDFRNKSLSYTKHYYIGGKRYASKIGTDIRLGHRLNKVSEFISDATAENIDVVDLLKGEPDNDTEAFNEIEDRIERIYSAFGLANNYCSGCTETQNNFDLGGHNPTELEDHVEQFYFHSDHLGSSNYITNYDGNITQHSEYLPFGELLVDEHRNSHNTRYKFNGKEFDQETGNYYGARYYDPKTSLWLSVDPLAEKYNEWSPYNYTLNNPVKYVDPDGRSVDEPDDWVESADGIIYWDDCATSQETTKDGETYLGKNVLVGTHNRDANGNEEINTAQFDLYLESNKEGPTATIHGNTVPADIEEYGTVAEGLYPARYSVYKGDGALLINEGRGVPTVSGNPNNPSNYNAEGNLKPINEHIVDEIFFHKGNYARPSLSTRSGSPISAGCQTGGCGKGTLPKFRNFIQKAKGFKGSYYLRGKPSIPFSSDIKGY